MDARDPLPQQFFEDVGKALFCDTIKRALFLSKSVKNNGFISKFFQRVCEQRLRKVYKMVLYSNTRSSSINNMFRRMSSVKEPMAATVTETEP